MLQIQFASRFAPRIGSLNRFTLTRFSTAGKGYVTDRSELPLNSLPTLTNRRPQKMELEPGKTYFYCTCGKSESQPWCDGSHRGTEWMPYKFTYEGDSKKKHMCMCKLNKDESEYRCDGSHKKFDYENPEKYAPDFRRDPEWLK